MNISHNIPNKEPMGIPQDYNNLAESFPITLKGKKRAVLSFSSLPIKKEDINLIKKYLDLMADNWSVAENEDE